MAYEVEQSFDGWPIPGSHETSGAKNYVGYAWDFCWDNSSFDVQIPSPWFVSGNPSQANWPCYFPYWANSDGGGSAPDFPSSAGARYGQPTSITGARGTHALSGKQYWEVEIVQLPTAVPSDFTFTEHSTGGETITSLTHDYDGTTHTFKWPTDLNTFFNPIIGLWPDDVTFDDDHSIMGLDNPAAQVRSIYCVPVSSKVGTKTTSGSPGGEDVVVNLLYWVWHTPDGGGDPEKWWLYSVREDLNPDPRLGFTVVTPATWAFIVGGGQVCTRGIYLPSTSQEWPPQPGDNSEGFFRLSFYIAPPGIGNNEVSRLLREGILMNGDLVDFFPLKINGQDIRNSPGTPISESACRTHINDIWSTIPATVDYGPGYDSSNNPVITQTGGYGMIEHSPPTSPTTEPDYAGDSFIAPNTQDPSGNQDPDPYSNYVAPGKHCIVFKGRADCCARTDTVGTDAGQNATHTYNFPQGPTIRPVAGVWTGCGTGGELKAGDVLMFATDTDTRQVWIGKNGTWYSATGTGDPKGGVKESVFMDGNAGDENYYPGVFLKLGPTQVKLRMSTEDQLYDPPDGFEPYEGWSPTMEEMAVEDVGEGIDGKGEAPWSNTCWA